MVNMPTLFQYIHFHAGCQLNEHNVGKYLHIIPSEDLVSLGLELGLSYHRLRELKSTENFCFKLISAWPREEDDVMQ